MSENTKIHKAKPTRPWWRKKRWWVVAIVFTALYLVVFNPRIPFDSANPQTYYNRLPSYIRATIIPYISLAEEKTLPSKYGDARSIKRWPGVRSCLVESEIHKEYPDLRFFDWDLFDSHEEASVCLWRIFTSLGPENSITWLEFHGFVVDKKFNRSVSRQLEKTYVGGIYPSRTLGSKLAQNPVSLLFSKSIWSESCGAQWEKSGELQRIFFSAQTK